MSHTDATADRTDTHSNEYYLPAMPSQTVVAAIRHVQRVLDRYRGPLGVSRVTE